MREHLDPVLSVEVLVTGGSLDAVRAALAAARSGRKTALIERRTYLGGALCASGRYWLEQGEWASLRQEFGWPDDGSIAVPRDDEFVLVPDAFKRALEDALLDAGVEIIIAARLIGRSATGVLFAGKAGQFEVATQEALDLHDENAAPGASWVLELTGVGESAFAQAAFEPEDGPARSVRLHRGDAGDGHALVEYLPRGEANAIAVATWLIENRPGFADARLATVLPEPLPRARPAREPNAQSVPIDSTGQPSFERELRETTYDVLVVGGGTSGVAAAIAAARAGATVVLAEMNHELGGTGTTGGVDSYWFGRRCGFNREVTRRLDEVQASLRWTGGKWCRPAKAAVWMAMAREAGVEVLLDSVLVDPLVELKRVRGAVLATKDGLLRVQAAVTVDATGDGDVADRAGAEVVYGSDREGVTMWYSLAPHPRPGLTKNNFTSNVDVGDPRDYTRAILAGRRRYTGHDHGSYVAPRESRHVLGEVRLTLTDQLRLRQWPDVVNVAFSNHDVKGQTTSDWLRLGFLPPNLEVEVPYRALVPRDMDGLLVAGKAISVTHDGLPAVRMQADLENLGYAAGLAAALAVRSGRQARDVDLADLQRELVKVGNLPPEVLRREARAQAPASVEDARHWIEQLDDSVPIFEFAFMPFEDVRREPVPFVEVCTAGPAIVSLLREELRQADSPRRLTVARALAWYGDTAATEVLLAAARAQLAGRALPHRGHIPCAVASPDHGAMPELTMLLHALAMLRDARTLPLLEEIVDRLEPTDERLRDPTSGLFHYVDAVCDVAERLGSPTFLPLLERLHGYDLLHGHVSRAPYQPDFFLERLGYLEIVIARAMARCGSLAGAKLLVEYIADSRCPLARNAWRELRLLSGLELPPESSAWGAWLATLDDMPPQPWAGEREHFEPWLAGG